MTPLRFRDWLPEQADRDDDVGTFARELVAIVDDLPLRHSLRELVDYLAVLGVPTDVRSLAPAAWSDWEATGAHDTPERRDAPTPAQADAVFDATPEQEALARRLERRYGKDGLPL